MTGDLVAELRRMAPHSVDGGLLLRAAGVLAGVERALDAAFDEGFAAGRKEAA